MAAKMNTKNLTLVVLIVILLGMGFLVFMQISQDSKVSPLNPSPPQTVQPAPAEQSGDDQHAMKQDIVKQAPDTEKPSEPPQEPAAKPQEQQTAATASPEPAPAPTDSELPQPAPVTPKTQPAPKEKAPAEQAAPTNVAPEPKTAAKPDAKAEIKPAAKQEPKPQKAQAKPAEQKKSSSPALNSVASISAEAVPGGLALRIVAANPIEGHKYFGLKNPDRAVLDLIGKWKKFNSPKVPENDAVKRIRSGLHDKYVRFVADLKPGAAGEVTVTKVSEREVVVTFK